MAIHADYEVPLDEESSSRIDARFGIASDSVKPFAPRELQLDIQRAIREEFVTVAKMIERSVTDSREKSLALTKLEEALMWAGKAIFS